MNEDPRCCGSGVCIIDAEGRCWCGQQWDGQKMCSPALAAAPATPAAGETRSEALGSASQVGPATGAGAGMAATALLMALAGGLATPDPVQAQREPAPPAAMQWPAPSAEQARAMQAVVQAQLEAFQSGDAARAYGFATAAIQQQFGSAEGFMAMVRSAYPMLIAPRSLAFRVPEPAPGGGVQPVQLRDARGRAWLATYQLQRQADGSWRIGGCIVVPDEPALRA